MTNKEKETQNCWDFFDCPKELREKCFAFIYKSGKNGWLVIDNHIGYSRRNKKEKCLDSPWLIKNNPKLKNFSKTK